MTFTALKPSLLTLGLIFGFFNVYAQERGAIEIGANPGLSLASVVVPGEINTETRVTFNIGVSGEYYFSDRWGAKLKVILDNKGYPNGSVMDQNFNRVTTDIYLNYLTLPLMATWHFSKHRRWYLSLGPYLGLLTSAKDSELQADIKNQINGFDYGYAFCMGYKYELTNTTRLFLECDGQYGLKNIIAGDNNYSVWNSRGAYNLGVLFNL
jgi:hypothetical protein